MSLNRGKTRARLRWLALALALTPPTVLANNCEAISKQIEVRIKASGAKGWALTTVPVDTQVPGKVVGQCDLGRRKIVYQPAARAATKPEPPILTECKDGSVSLGGDCPRHP